MKKNKAGKSPNNHNLDASMPQQDDEANVVTVRPKSAVPVWKTPSIHDSTSSQKTKPKPVHTNQQAAFVQPKDSGSTNDSFDEKAFEDLDPSLVKIEPPDDDVKIISEKTVNRSYVAEVLSFFRNFLPDSISESKLSILNSICVIVAAVIIIILFLVVVLN